MPWDDVVSSPCLLFSCAVNDSYRDLSCSLSDVPPLIIRGGGLSLSATLSVCSSNNDKVDASNNGDMLRFVTQEIIPPPPIPATFILPNATRNDSTRNDIIQPTQPSLSNLMQTMLIIHLHQLTKSRSFIWNLFAMHYCIYGVYIIHSIFK